MWFLTTILGSSLMVGAPYSQKELETRRPLQWRNSAQRYKYYYPDEPSSVNKPCDCRYCRRHKRVQ